MIINGMSGTNTQAGQMGMSQTTDAYSRNIQNQIVNAQKQLQELSSDEESCGGRTDRESHGEETCRGKRDKRSKRGKRDKSRKRDKSSPDRKGNRRTAGGEWLPCGRLLIKEIM